MSRIITISREFGSGGRELGKRMSDILGWDYYDREIITSIAQEQGLDERYVDLVLEQRPRQSITIRRSFTTLPQQNASAALLGKEKRVIDRIAQRGRDCVIVGRNADVFLADMHPFSIFVCSSMEAKMRRCRERAEADEQLSDRELKRRILSIDKNRANVRAMVGGNAWGKGSSYQLTVNTESWDMKALSPTLAEFALKWFEEREAGK